MLQDLTERKERPALVRFERRAVENKRESLRQGRWIGTDVDFVLVTPPYSKDCYEFKAEAFFDNTRREVRNGRTPKEHLDFWEDSFKKWKNGQELPINGTSIKTMTVLSPSQVKMLIGLNILTIEDLAACNDEGKRRIGMGAQDLINKAKAWLASSNDTGVVVQEISELKKENNVLKSMIDTMKNQIEKLTHQLELSDNPIIEPQGITKDELFDESIEESNVDNTLAERYEQKFGKKPHHRMTDASIQRALDEE